MWILDSDFSSRNLAAIVHFMRLCFHEHIVLSVSNSVKVNYRRRMLGSFDDVQKSVTYPVVMYFSLDQK